jgi:ribosome-associated toxin RatA of RatAB toxin-antitoxin module
MTEINRSALLPYSSNSVFQLINDIEAYPDYMDGCVGAEVLARDGAYMEARLDLSRAGGNYSFITRNQLIPDSAVIMELVEGPFRDFQGHWQLLALNEQACKVSLSLRFDLDSALLGKAAKIMFNSMADSLVNAMVVRAKKVYG